MIVTFGEAVYLMKDEVAENCQPVGWPKVANVMRDIIGAGVPIYV